MRFVDMNPEVSMFEPHQVPRTSRIYLPMEAEGALTILFPDLDTTGRQLNDFIGD